MESKLALDASERGHGQPEASDVVGVGRRQADPRLGGGLRASRLSVVWGDGERETGGEGEEAGGTKRELKTQRKVSKSVKQHKHRCFFNSTGEKGSLLSSFINIIIFTTEILIGNLKWNMSP